MASHQLCVFHATRRVVRAVSDVVQKVRRALPTPPPASKPTLLGRLRDTPPAADQHDPDAERYRWRLARRTLHWASPRSMSCTTTSHRLGPSDANSASITARFASGSSCRRRIRPLSLK
jgi:hypothetical protein